MIYIIDDIELFTDEQLAYSLSLAPHDINNKIMRYRNIIDRKLSIISYLLLKYGLKTEYGISDSPVISKSDYGKPYLENHPHIHFNISHCKKGVVCAISNKNIGIDIEEIHDYDKEMAAKVLLPDELQYVESSSNPAETFISFWTMKESLLKLKGLGLYEDIKNCLSTLPKDYKFSFVTNHPKSYILHVCHSTMENIEFINISDIKDLYKSMII